LLLYYGDYSNKTGGTVLVAELTGHS